MEEYGLIVTLDIYEDMIDELLDGDNMYFVAFQNYLGRQVKDAKVTCLKQDWPDDRSEVYRVHLIDNHGIDIFERQMHHIEYLKSIMSGFDYALKIQSDEAVVPIPQED